MDNEQIKKMENDPSDPEKNAPEPAGSDAVSSAETSRSLKPGAILAAKRIADGISEEQIASRLKMSVRQVRYLEADDYEALHGMATARGFVRAYARVLQIDPDPLVAAFSVKAKTPAAAHVPPGKPVEPFVKNREPFKRKRGRSGKLVILLIIIVIALIVAWNMKLFRFDRNILKKETPEATVPKAETVPSPAAPAPETKQTAPSADQAGSSENRPTDQASVNVAGTAVAGANVPVQAPTAQNVAATVTQAPAVKGASLVVSFTEKSWLRVQKKDGAVIAEYIGKPGEKRQHEVTEPVTVIVGFAPGVNMEYKGSPVDLVSSTNNSVAKVSLK